MWESIWSETHFTSALWIQRKPQKPSFLFFFHSCALRGVATVRRACNLSLTWRRTQRRSWYCERLCWASLLAERCVFLLCIHIVRIVMYKFLLFFLYQFTLHINTVQTLPAPVSVTAVISFEMFSHFFFPHLKTALVKPIPNVIQSIAMLFIVWQRKANFKWINKQIKVNLLGWIFSTKVCSVSTQSFDSLWV